MPEFLQTIITCGFGAAIATGVMSIIQYKIKRKDTKEDEEDQQTKDIRKLKDEIGELRKEISGLREYHKTDMDATRRRETEELQDIKDELCVLSYAMLAALSGLKQQGCNGDVTEAHTRLEKHLNQQAHGQR